MKRFLSLILLALTLSLLLTSCGTPQEKLVGTWVGNGDLDILGLEAPFEFASQWTFRDDGTAVAIVDSTPVEFSTYRTSADGDTLTLIMDDSETGCGIGYKIKGDVLLIQMGKSYAEFTKVD